jgi:hypothetical protein
MMVVGKGRRRTCIQHNLHRCNQVPIASPACLTLVASLCLPFLFLLPASPFLPHLRLPAYLCVQVLYPLSLGQVMAPRYAVGAGRDELDAELSAVLEVVRLK